MLLKIGTRYIETTLISEWNVLTTDGNNVLTLYAVMGASTARFTKDAEIDALLRWLDANSTDIMATEPAPVETPRRRVKQNWQVGDTAWVHTSTRAYEAKITGQNSGMWAVRFVDPPEGVDADHLCYDSELSDIPF